jgi:hypothetical protein
MMDSIGVLVGGSVMHTYMYIQYLDCGLPDPRYLSSGLLGFQQVLYTLLGTVYY